MPSNSAVKPDGDRVPYAAPQVPFMQPEMVHSGVLSDWLEDDRMSVPQTATVSFKPCLPSASNGYFVNILRVARKVSFRGTDTRGLYTRWCSGVVGTPGA